MGYMTVYATFICVAVFTVWLLRRNLAQRAYARHLRAIFFAEANDLVGKQELPDAHARHLVAMASLHHGSLTRFMVFSLFLRIFTGKVAGQGRSELRVDRVPTQLRGKYVLAYLAFVWGDSYQCALYGPFFRGTNSWIRDAIDEVKPDVNAHATRNVVEQVTRYPTRELESSALGLACA